MSKTKNQPAAVEPLREDELAGRISEAAATRNCASHALFAAGAAMGQLPGHDAQGVLLLQGMLNGALHVDAPADSDGETAGYLLGFALYVEHLADMGVFAEITDADESDPAFVAARQGAVDGLQTAARHIRGLARMALDGPPPA